MLELGREVGVRVRAPGRAQDLETRHLRRRDLGVHLLVGRAARQPARTGDRHALGDTDARHRHRILIEPPGGRHVLEPDLEHRVRPRAGRRDALLRRLDRRTARLDRGIGRRDLAEHGRQIERRRGGHAGDRHDEQERHDDARRARRTHGIDPSSRRVKRPRARTLNRCLEVALRRVIAPTEVGARRAGERDHDPRGSRTSRSRGSRPGLWVLGERRRAEVKRRVEGGEEWVGARLVGAKRRCRRRSARDQVGDRRDDQCRRRQHLGTRGRRRDLDAARHRAMRSLVLRVARRRRSGVTAGVLRRLRRSIVDVTHERPHAGNRAGHGREHAVVGADEENRERGDDEGRRYADAGR